MKQKNNGLALSFFFFIVLLSGVNADDPYRYFNWNVTYGELSPLGTKQQVILINDQFPGPLIESVTNDNLIITVTNNLDDPFLISWNGLQHKKNSWEDGVYGTNCPILPGQNFTYRLQVKDQIGSFFYFPSLAFHKAAGGYGGITISSRSVIRVPFPPPAAEYTILAGDWFKQSHKDLKNLLDSGKTLPSPDGILINGRGLHNKTYFTVNQGGTYRFRISNVGIATSFNFRIQGHKLKLVETEGSHTVQSTYDSLDVHLGQSYSVLVTCNQPAKDYIIVVSTRFSKKLITAKAFLHYNNTARSVARYLHTPSPPSGIKWSLNQARSIVRNLTANGPRPNPQGSYHYRNINITRTIRIGSSAPVIGGKQRYTVNGVSFVPADTPLKLADHFNISGVFTLGSIPDNPPGGVASLNTSVMAADFRAFLEIIFENSEDTMQSWHIDGYAFFVVGMDIGQWSNASRAQYNLQDAVARSTVQVYPKSWSAIYMALDNVGMWNIRSEDWARQYLGQQFYLRVYSPLNSHWDEYYMPDNAILCGRAKH